MDIETTRGVAARIWCDHEFQHIEMDTDLAEEIAQKLLICANKAVERDRAKHPAGYMGDLNGHGCDPDTV